MKKNSGNNLLRFIIVLISACSFGCASVPSKVNQSDFSAPASAVVMPKPEIGIYHSVEAGETLYRIAKIYGIDVDAITKANNIEDPTEVEIGQKLFIPGADGKKKAEFSIGTSEDFIWPVRGKVILKFGQNLSGMVNKGINIQPYYDNCDVVASRSGKIVFYHDNFLDQGKTIIIDHQDGFFTIYGKNSAVFVKPGEFVYRGSVISKIGPVNKDKNNYLHFQIRKGYISKNPYFYLPK